MSDKRIFLVDDDELLGTMLSDFLLSKDIRNVSLFLSGEQCLEKLKTVKPDVVVLDYHLNTIAPEAVNGMRILEIIHSVYPEIFIIILSSDESFDVAAQTISKGAIRYVLKGKESFHEVAAIIEGL